MTADFREMNLPAPIHGALRKMNFVTATPIQAAAIGPALEGRDVIGRAQTGTGKTAAFCIPIVAKILEKPSAGALILAPTRELALQISDVLRQLTVEVPNIRTTLIIGGVDMYKQIRELRGRPSIVVATPGRLNDHLRRKSIQLNKIEILVLDEGDRMLDMGFETQIIEILKHVSEQRQTFLFSATMPEKIKKLADRYMKNPKFIAVGEESKPTASLAHSIVHVTKDNKRDILLDQLNARKGSVLIFSNTKHGTNRLTTYLEEYGYAVARIHGGRSQGQRNQALQGFRSGKFRILVATDVAARGLDVPQIAHVINFDLPKDLDDYVHRIGRTARAGNVGEAICLLAKEDHSHWNLIARQNDLEVLPGAKYGGKPAGRPNGRHAEKHTGHAAGKSNPKPHRGQSRNGDARNGDTRNGDGAKKAGGKGSHQGGKPWWIKKRREQKDSRARAG